jgi:U4/U6 small nuclear ribonucleoprotein PRP31
VLGAKRKILSGFSSANAALHQGFIYASDIIQNCPEEFRSKAARVVGAKCTLLARIDAYGSDPSGTQGAQMKVEWLPTQICCRGSEKWGNTHFSSEQGA